jgi:hypothetical protein
MLERLFGTRYPIARRVLAHTLEGRTFRGVFWQLRAEFIVLRDVNMMVPGEQPVPIDGEVLVYRPHVTFIQVLPERAR